MRRGLVGFLFPSLLFAGTVWFPAGGNDISQVPNLWQDGFQLGYKLGYEYCLIDVKGIDKLQNELTSVKLLLNQLKGYGKEKGEYVEITLKIPKKRLALIRIAKHLQEIFSKKEKWKGYIIYGELNNVPEAKIGWYIRQAQKLGFEPLKLGKVVIFDSEVSQVDAETVAKKLSQAFGIKLKVLKVD
jgi:hypothetical protein